MNSRWRRLAYGHVSAAALDDIYRQMAEEDIWKIQYQVRHSVPHKMFREEFICAIDAYSKKMLDYADRSGNRFYSIAYEVAEQWIDKLSFYWDYMDRKKRKKQ